MRQVTPYYNPEWGRFLNSDVILGQMAKLLSHNSYAYCINNPVNLEDASGHFFTRLNKFYYNASLTLVKGWLALRLYINVKITNVVKKALNINTIDKIDKIDDALFSKGTSNPAHNAAQYQKLKRELVVEEVQSVVNTTKHGAERLLKRGFTPDDILALKLTPDKIMSQTDGAQVFIKNIGNRKFNVIVEGENGVITALKNIGEKSLNRLSNNYGWK